MILFSKNKPPKNAIHPECVIPAQAGIPCKDRTQIIMRMMMTMILLLKKRRPTHAPSFHHNTDSCLRRNDGKLCSLHKHHSLQLMIPPAIILLGSPLMLSPSFPRRRESSQPGISLPNSPKLPIPLTQIIRRI